MTTPAALSAAAIGLGLALVGIWVARPRVSVLEQRLEAMLAVDSPAAAPRRGLDAVAAALARLLGRVLGGADHVRSRMERAGLVPDVDTFRTSQALWAMTGFAGAACIVLVTGNSTRGPLSASALVLLAAGFGVVLRDQQLTRLAERREARMIVEFPAIADMLALAVAAVWGWTWSQSQYFIKDSGGRVTVYQGVDSKLGPIDLRHQQESTNIPTADLPEFWRSKVTSGIDASSEKEAAATVERLRAEMVACLAASASGNECTK